VVDGPAGPVFIPKNLATLPRGSLWDQKNLRGKGKGGLGTWETGGENNFTAHDMPRLLFRENTPKQNPSHFRGLLGGDNPLRGGAPFRCQLHVRLFGLSQTPLGGWGLSELSGVSGGRGFPFPVRTNKKRGGVSGRGNTQMNWPFPAGGEQKKNRGGKAGVKKKLFGAIGAHFGVIRGLCFCVTRFFQQKKKTKNYGRRGKSFRPCKKEGRLRFHIFPFFAHKLKWAPAGADSNKILTKKSPTSRRIVAFPVVGQKCFAGGGWVGMGKKPGAVGPPSDYPREQKKKGSVVGGNGGGSAWKKNIFSA